VAGPEDRLSGVGTWDPPLTGKGASRTSGGRLEVSMASDVASQGGGAGPGRDRYWRAC
jgi:hypothetical protein